MTEPFSLRVNNRWVDIPSVQQSVDVSAERPLDEWVSVGGVRHITVARRAPRTWSLPLGDLTGPEEVGALMVAAQGDGGDVMLWDDSVARANMLDPVVIAPPVGTTVLQAGSSGLWLRSLTVGTSSETTAHVRGVIRFTQHLKQAPKYYLSYWCDGNPTFTAKVGTATHPLTGVSGSYRVHELTLAASGDVDVTFEIPDSTSYSVVGLALSTQHPNGRYYAPQKNPVRVQVLDPSLSLEMLLNGAQGLGQRTVTIKEVGA